jgi:hypothetical protein
MAVTHVAYLQVLLAYNLRVRYPTVIRREINEQKDRQSQLYFQTISSINIFVYYNQQTAQCLINITVDTLL